MSPPSPRRELALAIVAAVLLVAVRSFVPLAYEQVYFDSDQAVVGLMAKHLSELRDFPLFFYGQNYMLGVQAWIAAPFVWLGGATVTMIRLPLLIINATVPSLLILMIVRLGVRPALAFVAALPLIVTTPVMSMALYATLGASVEPFLYVLALWWLRRRPLAFGACCAWARCTASSRFSRCRRWPPCISSSGGRCAGRPSAAAPPPSRERGSRSTG